jgi:phosphoserine phosphatase
LVSDDIAAWVRKRHDEYLAGKVSEDEMCGEMVTINKGRSETEMLAAVGEFFEDSMLNTVFPEMRELVRHLHDQGCEVWAVSSSNDWVIRAGMKHFAIPESRILAASVEMENGIVTDRLVRVPSGEGKPLALREVAKREPDVAFGNSRWDVAMLEMAGTAFAVNPNPDLEKLAGDKGWQVYWPDAVKVGS